MGTAVASSLLLEVDQVLADGVRGHRWLHELVSTDVESDLGVGVDLNEAVDALLALTAGLADAVGRLAAEIDALKARAALERD
jgi:hypothetical protein